MSSSSPLSLLSPSLSSFYSSGYSLIWISGVGLIGVKKGLETFLSYHTPGVRVITLLATEAVAIYLGLIVSVYIVAVGSVLSSSSITLGD